MRFPNLDPNHESVPAVDKISLADFHSLEEWDGGFIAFECENEADRSPLFDYLRVGGQKGVDGKSEIIADRFLIFRLISLCLYVLFPGQLTYKPEIAIVDIWPGSFGNTCIK